MSLSAMTGVFGLYPQGNIDGRVLVRTGPTTLYSFSFSRQAGTANVFWRKSTDNGATWMPGGQVSTLSTVAFCLWYDQWTPGDTGTKIHIFHIETDLDDVRYNSLDTASDTLSGVVTVAALASATTAAYCSCCKARGGNLYVAFDIDGGTETGFYRSTDGGTSFGTRSNSINEAAADFYQLAPGNYADSQDIDAVFWDTSADELSLKTHDDSANSWAEASISTGMAEVLKTVAGPQFSSMVRHSDGHLIVLAWNAHDVSTADLKCWDINGSGSITAKTDVITNADDVQGTFLFIDQATDDLFAFYLGKSDGSETVGTSVGVYGKRSTDGGATWGAEFALDYPLADYDWMGGVPSYAGAPYTVMVSNDAVDELLVWFARSPSAGGMLLGSGVRRAASF
jgi:hypothetical protein